MRIHPYILLMTAPVLIAAIVIASLLSGLKTIDATTVYAALFQFDPANVDHQIIAKSRLPRVEGALLIGGALAVSGAIMQGITRNDLASPAIMGISDGSILAITISMIVLPEASSFERILFSLAGSALAAVLVFSIGALLANGLSPVRLAVLGTVTGTFLNSFAYAISCYFEVSQDISFWYYARLHQLQPDQVQLIVPFILLGGFMVLLLAKPISIFSLGEEVAISLGQRLIAVKIAATIAVMLLTGSAVALAGKIAFVGLIIPHIARYLVGVDYKWVIPCSMVLGAEFLAGADILSRFLNYPFETPVGVLTSLVGVPFFLYLAKRRGGSSCV